MSTPILLVCLSTRWLGAARIPRSLQRAGFEVSMLTPHGSLAAKSRFIAKVGYLDANTTPAQWAHAFVATIKATSPRFVMPCDDTAVRLLQALVLTPSDAMPATLVLQLGALIRSSLGDPAHYRTIVGKTQLPAAAEALGIHVPPFRVISDVEEAAAFAAVHGYPVVLKRDHSNAGDGVVVCANRSALGHAMPALTRATRDLQDSSGNLLVQAHIAGRTKFYSAMAWKGTILTGFAGEKVVANPEADGPPTVVRYYRSPVLRDVTSKLAAGFGITGFISPEFIEDERTGTAFLIAIHRRLVGGAHRGSAIGVDHCAALHAALTDAPVSTRGDLDDGEEHVTVHFPQEWLRDPGSPWLSDHLVDVPWDDPNLIEAMLAMRHE